MTKIGMFLYLELREYYLQNNSNKNYQEIINCQNNMKYKYQIKNINYSYRINKCKKYNSNDQKNKNYKIDKIIKKYFFLQNYVIIHFFIFFFV